MGIFCILSSKDLGCTKGKMYAGSCIPSLEVVNRYSSKCIYCMKSVLIYYSLLAALLLIINLMRDLIFMKNLSHPIRLFMIFSVLCEENYFDFWIVLLSRINFWVTDGVLTVAELYFIVPFISIIKFWLGIIASTF